MLDETQKLVVKKTGTTRDLDRTRHAMELCQDALGAPCPTGVEWQADGGPAMRKHPGPWRHLRYR